MGPSRLPSGVHNAQPEYSGCDQGRPDDSQVRRVCEVLGSRVAGGGEPLRIPHIYTEISAPGIRPCGNGQRCPDPSGSISGGLRGLRLGWFRGQVRGVSGTGGVCPGSAVGEPDSPLPRGDPRWASKTSTVCPEEIGADPVRRGAGRSHLVRRHDVDGRVTAIVRADTRQMWGKADGVFRSRGPRSR